MSVGVSQPREPVPLRALRLGEALTLRPQGGVAMEPDTALTPLLTAALAPPRTRAPMLWDARAPDEGLAPLTLFDQTPWLLTLSSRWSLAQALAAYARPLADGADGRTHWSLALRGYAGRLRLEATHDDGARVALDVELGSRLLGATDDWRAMLDDLARADLSLAAELDAPVNERWGDDVLPRRRSPTESLLLLRHLLRAGELRNAVEAVARDPARALTSAVTLVTHDRATRVHPDELAARGLVDAASQGVAREHGPRVTRDLPENRFTLYILASFADCARELARDDAPVARSLRRLAATLAAELVGLHDALAQGVLRGVRARHEPMPSSALMRRRDGYRALAAAWVRFLAPPGPLSALDAWAGLADAPRLYERWCALQVARALRLRDDDVVALASGVASRRCAWGGVDVVVHAQQAMVDGASYGMAFRPDLVLACGARRLVFDAKYQIDDEAGGVPPEAIVKMHAYRDALAGVWGAWALYPGEETRSWEAPGGRGGGVGAVALRPGHAHGGALEAVIARFLGAAEEP